MWSNNLLQLTTTTKIILTLTHLRFDFLNWLISTLYFHFSCSFPFASFTFVFKLSPAAALATYTCSPYFLCFTVRAGRGIPTYFPCMCVILRVKRKSWIKPVWPIWNGQTGAAWFISSSPPPFIDSFLINYVVRGETVSPNVYL